jgi:hypothetical protein
VIGVVGQLPDLARDFFQRYAATIVQVQRFDAKHGPSNKVSLLGLDVLDDWEHVILLDCDTIVVQDPARYLRPEGLAAKPADGPTTAPEVVRQIGTMFGLDVPVDIYRHEIADRPCGPYFNSGVLALARSWRKRLAAAWAEYNRRVLMLREEFPEVRVFADQISLALAVTDTGVPITILPSAANLPVHLPADLYPDRFQSLDPTIIHYHHLYDDAGSLLRTPLRQADRRVAAFNARLSAEKHGAEPLSNRKPRQNAVAAKPKVIVGSGWWCNGAASDHDLGSARTRSTWFFDIWLRQVLDCLEPARVVITDSNSPIKPDLENRSDLVWIELDKNYGHANDIRQGRISTKYSGFTRSVLNGAMYALCCDADYYVYIEQDCLVKGKNLLAAAKGESTSDILLGPITEGGRGLHGKPAARMLQQSFMIVRRPGLETFISALLQAKWTDGQVSPEEIMRRSFPHFDTIQIPFGRSRPLDYQCSHCYVHHLLDDELGLFLGSLGKSSSEPALSPDPFYAHL